MLEALELTFYSIRHAIQTSRKIKEDYAIIIALPQHSHRKRQAIPAHKHSTPRQGFRSASQNPCPKAKLLCSYAKAVYPLQPEYSNFISIQYAYLYIYITVLIFARNEMRCMFSISTNNAIFANFTDIGTTDKNFDIFEIYMLLLSEPHPNLYSNLIYPKKCFF